MHIFRYLSKIISRFWKFLPFPDQVKRLLILFFIIILCFSGARKILVPPTFGERGHYRASAVDSTAALEISYLGEEKCAECHEEKAEKNDPPIIKICLVKFVTGPVQHTLKIRKKTLPKIRNKINSVHGATVTILPNLQVLPRLIS